MCVTDSNSWLLAEDGTIISTDQAGIKNKDALLIMKGLSPHYFAKNVVSDQLLTELSAFKEMLETHITEKTVLVDTDDLYHINLILNDEVFVYLGEFSQANSKIIQLKQFLNYISDEKFAKMSYIDLRIDQKVYVKYGT